MPPFPGADTNMSTRKPSRRIRRTKRSRPSGRRGVATVELAIILPVLLLLIFGTLEICQRLILRQAAVVTAYESARLAARRSSSADQVVARGEAIMTSRRVTGGRVELVPANLTGVPTGTELEVIVTIPVDGNTAISYVLPGTDEISVIATMLRE